MRTEPVAAFRAARRRRESGQAAVEAVLVLPFLLLLVILAENSTVLMNRKLTATIEARVDAWSTGLSGRCGFQARCDTADGRDWLRGMERAGGSPTRGITRSVRRAPAPNTTEVTRTRSFEPFGDDRLVTPLQLEGTHAVSVNPAWELDDLPIGYDRELKRKLRSMRTIFPSLFPRSR